MFSVGWQAVEMTTSEETNGGQEVPAGRGRTGEEGGMVYLCGPAASARSPSSAGSRCKPCCPRSQTRSTAGDRFSFTHTQRKSPAANAVLTFPPVTEKLANMQYFSFLWPV